MVLPVMSVIVRVWPVSIALEVFGIRRMVARAMMSPMTTIPAIIFPDVLFNPNRSAFFLIISLPAISGWFS
jgi:hypothetical protein